MSDISRALLWNAKHIALTAAFFCGASNFIHPFLSDEPVEIQERLWLGSLHSASRAFEAGSVDAILNLSGYSYRNSVLKKITKTREVELFEICLEDKDITIVEEEYFRLIFTYCANIINDKLVEGKSILVHCSAGVNRAATAICFYLISRGYSPADAISLVEANNRQRGYPALTNATFKKLIMTQPQNANAR